MRLKRRSATPLEERLGYRFRRPELLERALTHRSFANEQGLEENYERLEFLGDAVLGMLAAEWLFERHPDLPEGELSKLKSSLVSERTLAAHARRVELGEELRLGVGEERSGGRGKRSLLADSMEAVLGAVWLDGGVGAARPVVRAFLETATAARKGRDVGDHKTQLQEVLQARGWERPTYRVAAEEGPDHDKRFAVECEVRGEVLGRGEGPSKKLAEQRAAARALERLAERAAAEPGEDGSPRPLKSTPGHP